MRCVLSSLFLVLAASTALAQDMPNSMNMTCAEASELVRQRGQVVIASGPEVFQRLTSDPGICDAQHTATPTWIPTRDQSQCLAGYRCAERVEKGG